MKRHQNFSSHSTIKSSIDRKLGYHRWTARCATSVDTSCTTVGTSCTTNPQQITVMQLERYSWPTCSQQPRYVDWHIGVINKLDRQRVVDHTTDLPWWNFLSLGQSSRGSTVIFGSSQISLTQCGIGRRKPTCQNQFNSSCSFDTILACDEQTWQTDTRRQNILR